MEQILYPRGKPLLTPEQFDKIGAWIVCAVIVFLMWFNHHNAPENHDAIPSQAWSFGEPGE